MSIGLSLKDVEAAERIVNVIRKLEDSLKCYLRRVTGLLSNVIKSIPSDMSHFKKTIDYKDRDEELLAKRISKLPSPQSEDGFEEGIKAVVVDPVVSEEEQRKKAGAIIENAKKEASAILEAAKDEAQRLKKDTFEKAREQGYEEGINKGSKEIQEIKKNLLEERELQKKEYEKLLVETSGVVTELMIS